MTTDALCPSGACNIYMGYFTTTNIDTKNGVTHAPTFPGSNWAYSGPLIQNGTTDCYVIQVAGYYEFLLNGTLSAQSIPDNYLTQLLAGIAQVNTVGATVKYSTTMTPVLAYFYQAASFPGFADTGQQWVNVRTTLKTQCSVGDLIFPFGFDMNPGLDDGTASYFQGLGGGSGGVVPSYSIFEGFQIQ